jgi:hypothetical protein
MKEEFNEAFLSQSQFGKETQNTAEFQMNENFYLNLCEKLKTLCIHEKCGNDSELKSNQISTFQQIQVSFIRLPQPLPRAFFNSLQKTQIKLIVSPNTKKTNTIQILRTDQTLVVRIDAIIAQQFKKQAPIRTIKKIQISSTTELDAQNSKTLPKFADVKTSTEEPKNDYFNTNILINFPFCGNYVINIDLFILDDCDNVWRHTAEKHQIAVKVEEDPNRQKLFAALAQAQALSSSATLAQQMDTY